jgi:hypothetical protein
LNSARKGNAFNNFSFDLTLHMCTSYGQILHRNSSRVRGHLYSSEIASQHTSQKLQNHNTTHPTQKKTTCTNYRPNFTLRKHCQKNRLFKLLVVAWYECMRSPTPMPTPTHTPNPIPTPTLTPALNHESWPSLSSEYQPSGYCMLLVFMSLSASPPVACHRS